MDYTKQTEEKVKTEISDVKRKLQRAEELLENITTQDPLAPDSVGNDPLVNKLKEE